jgi:CBS domain containing-hemolysin-like protein
VIGDITDLRDRHPLYVFSGSDVIIASGKLEIDELERIFHVSLRRQSNVVTIGGWLVEELGEIPKAGVQYEKDRLRFHVLVAEPNRITRLYIRHLSPQESKDIPRRLMQGEGKSGK